MFDPYKSMLMSKTIIFANSKKSNLIKANGFIKYEFILFVFFFNNNN